MELFVDGHRLGDVDLARLLVLGRIVELAQRRVAGASVVPPV